MIHLMRPEALQCQWQRSSTRRTGHSRLNTNQLPQSPPQGHPPKFPRYCPFATL